VAKIVLDPGHGGHDPGAIGPKGTKEKDVALKVAKLLLTKLAPTAQVTLTRYRDEFKELWERSRYANDINADLFISIHCNAATNRTAHGTETLVYKLGSRAEKLARKIQAKLVAALVTHNRGVKARPELYVLFRTKMPAVLVELAFISNPVEERKLTDPGYQAKAANAIAEAVAEYLRHS